ncbi:hypothetical protein [Halobacillus litoralis]|uniref:hypothetical protein n=1 Tax=Halobacillus litoralis TaxID=45668 RepID=UPI001CD2C7D1|nr:hypothetical protein [Halobacillus litoralis]MCA1021484.1 hypothetical protein [Halobacillus litoralis]
MDDLKGFISRRMEHADRWVKYLKNEHGDLPSKTHTYYGGHRLGYWEGKLAAYDHILEKLENK